MLLLNEGHCFRSSVINLCKNPEIKEQHFQLESGNFDTLIKLSKLGYGMTLLPYLTAADLNPDLQQFIKPIAEPKPTREVSLVYSDTHLKSAVIDKLEQIIRQSVPQKLLLERNTVLKPA